MILLLGKGGSGKDTLQKELERLGIKKTAPYTTRPMRQGETDGRDYCFVTEAKFLEMAGEGLFACQNSYYVASGDTWRYGILAESLSGNASVQTNPLQLDELLAAIKGPALTVYLQASEKALLKRREGRGQESRDEIGRRLASDYFDFLGLENKVDITLNTENLPPEIIARMVKHMHDIACGMPDT